MTSKIRKYKYCEFLFAFPWTTQRKPAVMLWRNPNHLMQIPMWPRTGLWPWVSHSGSKFSNPGQSFGALADILTSRRERWVRETCVPISIQHSFQCDFIISFGLPWWLRSREPTCQSRRCGFKPWDGKTPLEKKMATHPSILALKIPWTEELGMLQCMGLQRVRHNLVTKQQ